MHSTYQKGKKAELLVEMRAYEKGWLVSRPTVEARYDLILDDGKRLHRVQVKYTSQVTKGCQGSFTAPTSRQTRGSGDVKTYGGNEVDLLAVYIEPLGKIVMLPQSMIEGKRTITMRSTASTHGNRLGKALLIADFEW